MDSHGIRYPAAYSADRSVIILVEAAPRERGRTVFLRPLRSTYVSGRGKFPRSATFRHTTYGRLSPWTLFTTYAIKPIEQAHMKARQDAG